MSLTITNKCWSQYLEQKLNNLSTCINRTSSVSADCVQWSTWYCNCQILLPIIMTGLAPSIRQSFFMSFFFIRDCCSLIKLTFGLYFLQDGTEAVVKDVLPGDSVHSLLSILDIITARIHLYSSHTCVLKQISIHQPKHLWHTNNKIDSNLVFGWKI